MISSFGLIPRRPGVSPRGHYWQPDGTPAARIPAVRGDLQSHQLESEPLRRRLVPGMHFARPWTGKLLHFDSETGVGRSCDLASRPGAISPLPHVDRVI